MTIAALDALAETEAGLAADFKAGTITEVQLAEGLAAAYQEAFGGASTPLEAAALAAEAISRLTTFLDEFLGNVGLTIKGTLAASGDLPTSGNAVGDGYLIGGNLWVWTGTPGGWTNAGAIVGPAGPSVELQKSSTHVQWRVVGGSSWSNLIPLADLVGSAGPAIELGTSLTHVRWRVVGTTDWTNLIAIADLRGAPGDPGTNGLDGWTPVFAIVSDGARRVLQISDWVGGEGTKPTTGQYVGPSGLTGTLASAVDLRGPAGAAGTGTGDVTGPSTTTAGRLARFADTTGDLLDEGPSVSTDGTLAANSDAILATQKAVKTYVDAALAAADAFQPKGLIDCSTNPNYPAADAGHTYRASVAGRIGGASGATVDVGDMIICFVDGSAAGTQATVGANWGIIQGNLVLALTAADIGVSVQAYDADLAAIAALATTEFGRSLLTLANVDGIKPLEAYPVAISDESTNLTTGAAKVTFRMPYAFTLVGLPRASLTTASTSGNPTFDINVGGSSILGANKLSIDANERTSTTAATPTTVATSSIADDAEVTIDIDVAGNGAKGAKIYLIGRRT
jgi:hypothetical protein